MILYLARKKIVNIVNIIDFLNTLTKEFIDFSIKDDFVLRLLRPKTLCFTFGPTDGSDYP